MILTDRGKHTLTITINDPERSNPITPEIADAMCRALGAVQPDHDVRAIVLTGAEGTFCAGGDLRNMPPVSLIAAHERLDIYARLVRSIRGSRQPVIAAVEGAAAGIGVGIATNCDFIVAAEDARFLIPFSRLGLYPDGGLVHGLSQRVGPSRARALLLLGDPISPAESDTVGLVDVTSERGNALRRAYELADRLAQRSTGSIERIKRGTLVAGQGLDDTLAVERKNQSELYFTDDFLARRDRFFGRS